MEHYANRSGNSGVVAYEIGQDSIIVKFVDGWRYSYTYESAGTDNVERMKMLAAQGKGLSAFISTTVRNDFAQKLPP
ncbi:MAG: hypothetical protein JSR66_22245 [Proteobacteria bacterium]|nr:hypothetical protein [Pseudomonadota bacterium]